MFDEGSRCPIQGTIGCIPDSIPMVFSWCSLGILGDFFTHKYPRAVGLVYGFPIGARGPTRASSMRYWLMSMAAGSDGRKTAMYSAVYKAGTGSYENSIWIFLTMGIVYLPT